MTAGTRRIVRRAAVAAYVATGAALIGLVTIALFFWIGQPWGTLNDVAVLVMTLAVAPLMLAFWELGGLTPTACGPRQLTPTPRTTNHGGKPIHRCRRRRRARADANRTGSTDLTHDRPC